MGPGKRDNLKTCLCILLALAALSVAYCHESVYSVSTLEAGPAGVAGAVTGRLGGIESFLYNPATFTSYSSIYRPERATVKLYLNPCAVAAYAKEYSDGGHSPRHSIFGPAMFMLRAASVTVHPFTIGGIFGEEELDLNPGSELATVHQDARWLEMRDLPDRHRSICFAHLALAERVQVGATITAHIRRQFIEAVGASYGVFLAPSPAVQLGVSFMEFPLGYEQSRRTIAGFGDQTVNAGVNLSPDKDTRFSFDIRNVFHEKDTLNVELRIGAERNFMDHISLRAGGIPRTQQGDYVLTMGIGLLDLYSLRGMQHYRRVPSHVLNYAIMRRADDVSSHYIHLLTFSVEIG